MGKPVAYLFNYWNKIL